MVGVFPLFWLYCSRVLWNVEEVLSIKIRGMFCRSSYQLISAVGRGGKRWWDRFPSACTKRLCTKMENQQQTGSYGKIPFRSDAWKYFTSGAVITASIATVWYYKKEKSRYEKEQSKYSEEKKNEVVKKTMLQPIPVKHLRYPHLWAKVQIDMMHSLVFSKDSSLVLIEGASGSGKTTLVQKVLNERITKDKVPCYYLPLETVKMDHFYTQFMKSFGIGDAINRGIIAECTVQGDTLISVFRRLKEETGAPCVLVLDNAQYLFQHKKGRDVALFLQECHKEGLMTVIFICSDLSVHGEFQNLSRLRYRSLPPVPDDEMKSYLMGPVNDYLKASNCQLMSEKLAKFFVSGFGSNFAELNYFVIDVWNKWCIGEEEFRAYYTSSYFDTFMSISKYSEAKTILEDLKQHGSIGYRNAYSVEAVAYLVRENIIALHNNKYIWNKRIVCIAYEEFTKAKGSPPKNRS